MKKNTSSGLKINRVVIMFAINVLLLSVYMASIAVEVNGLLSSNSTLLPTSNSTENETDQKGTIASFPGSLDSDRRHMPLL